MVVFFQPTFHKYFLERAQGWNPNLAYSFSDVIEFTCLGFCLPHLPSGGTGALLSSNASLTQSVDRVCMSLLQGSEGLSPSSATLSTWEISPDPSLRQCYSPPLLCTPSPPNYPSMKMNNSSSWVEDHLKNILWEESVWENMKKGLESLPHVT